MHQPDSSGRLLGVGQYQRLGTQHEDALTEGIPREPFENVAKKLED